jgi:peptidoglycan/LPS O-acetylase OafA/YrhL
VLAVPFMAAVAIEGPLDRHLLLRIAAAAAVVVVALALRSLLASCGRTGRLVSLVGEASYSIYLSHWFVMSILGKLAGVIGLPATADVPVRLIGVMLALGFGTVFYLLVEKPLDRSLRRLGIDGRASAKPEPARSLAFSVDLHPPRSGYPADSAGSLKATGIAVPLMANRTEMPRKNRP